MTNRYNPFDYWPRHDYSLPGEKPLDPEDYGLVYFFRLYLVGVEYQDVVDEFTLYPPHADPNDWSWRRDPKPRHE